MLLIYPTNLFEIMEMPLIINFINRIKSISLKNKKNLLNLYDIDRMIYDSASNKIFVILKGDKSSSDNSIISFRYLHNLAFDQQNIFFEVKGITKTLENLNFKISKIEIGGKNLDKNPEGLLYLHKRFVSTIMRIKPIEALFICLQINKKIYLSSKWMPILTSKLQLNSDLEKQNSYNIFYSSINEPWLMNEESVI